MASLHQTCDPYADEEHCAGSAVGVVHLLDGLDHGGAAQVLVDMVTGLDPNQYVATVCVTRPLKNTERVNFLAQHNIPIIALERRSGSDILGWRRVIDLFSMTTILHAHSESSNAWARLWGQLLKIPIVITQDHKAPEEKTRVFQLIDRFLGPFSSRVIAVSEIDRQKLIAREGHRPERVVTIHNGIAIQRFALPISQQEARIHASLPQDGILLGIIGRLEYQKGHDFLFEALSQLNTGLDTTLKLLVVGLGSRLSELQTLAKKLGIDSRVLFLGQRSDIPLILKAADGLVLSSRWECHPLVVLEALAARCPVIASDVGGVREALNGGEAGVIIPPRDVSALAQAIRLLVEQPESMATKIEAGYKLVVSQFSKEKMVQDLENLYAELLDEIRRDAQSDRTVGDMS